MALGKQRSSLTVTILATVIGTGFAIAGLWSMGRYAVEYASFASGRTHKNLQSIILQGTHIELRQYASIAIPGRRSTYQISAVLGQDRPLLIAHETSLSGVPDILLRGNRTEERLVRESLGESSREQIWFAVESPHWFYCSKLALSLLVTGLGLLVAHGFIQKHRSHPDWS